MRMRRRKRREIVQPKVLVRFALVGAVAVACIWATTAVTIPLVLGPRTPDSTRGWTLATAEIQSASASGLLERPSARNRRRAQTLAEAALRKEPVNVVAVRTLAFVRLLDRREAAATRLFRYAESLSRRDLPTQLWLIEYHVARNDIQGALRHYDRALRASTSSRELLYPILIQASSDRAIAQPLARFLAVRPPWWSSFVEAMIATENPPATGVALVTQAVRLDPEDTYERGLLAGALNKLVEAGAYGTAQALYEQARSGNRARRELVRNPDFAMSAAIPPFEWQLHDTPGLAAVVETREGAPGGRALSIIAENGRNGEVARQLLTASPGQYVLTGIGGAIATEEPARPVISLVCAGRNGAVLARTTFPRSGDSPQRFSLRLSVPSRGCGAQWLRIESGIGRDPRDELPSWIASLSVRRV